MSKQTTIPSVLHPNERAYYIGSGLESWNKRGQRPLFDGITVFDTCGDGLTQHSPDRVAQFEDLIDVCLSCSQAIVADPRNEALNRLTYILHCTAFDEALIRFAFTVKYDEKKEQYYSLAERKIGRSDKLRHDRRYERVEPRHDGSAIAVSGMLYHHSQPDWLARVIMARNIRNLEYEIRGSYITHTEEILPPVSELDNNWRTALDGFIKAVEAMRAIEYAATSIECVAGNMNRKAAA